MDFLKWSHNRFLFLLRDNRNRTERTTSVVQGGCTKLMFNVTETWNRNCNLFDWLGKCIIGIQLHASVWEYLSRPMLELTRWYQDLNLILRNFRNLRSVKISWEIIHIRYKYYEQHFVKVIDGNYLRINWFLRWCK